MQCLLSLLLLPDKFFCNSILFLKIYSAINWDYQNEFSRIVFQPWLKKQFSKYEIDMTSGSFFHFKFENHEK